MEFWGKPRMTNRRKSFWGKRSKATFIVGPHKKIFKNRQQKRANSLQLLALNTTCPNPSKMKKTTNSNLNKNFGNASNVPLSVSRVFLIW